MLYPTSYRTPTCMYEGLGADYINKDVEAKGINQAKVSSKAWKWQSGALKSITLDSFIALDSYIGQESVGPRGSSRVARERQSLVLF